MWNEARSTAALRWAIVGAGDIVRQRAGPAILALSREGRTQVVGLAARRRGPLEEAARGLGIRACTTDAMALVRSSEVDAVYVATPPSSHFSFTWAALEAGKHVLCEKPLTLCPEESAALAELAFRRSRVLAVAFYRRLFPLVSRVSDAIREGSLGSPLHLSMVNAFPYDPKPSAAGAWRLEPSISGGGPLMDVGCHRVDLARHLLGEVAHVACLLSAGRGLRPRCVEGEANLSLSMRSGATVTIIVSHDTEQIIDTLELVGTQGTLRVPCLEGTSVVFERADGQSVLEAQPVTNGHSALFADFVSAVATGHRPVADGWDGFEANRILAAAYDSAYDGQSRSLCECCHVWA